MENGATRFSLLEIDDIAPSSTAASEVAESAPLPETSSDKTTSPAVDPIDAFAARVRREREERAAAERALREKQEADRHAAEAKRQQLAAKRAQIWAVEKASDTTGAIVFWQLGGTVDLAKLRTAMSAEGLGDHFLPEGCSAKVALSRAVTELRSRDMLVRKHPTAGGWALCPRDVKDDKLAFAQSARFYLDEAESLAFEGEISSDDATAVRETFTRCFGQLLTSDVSTWLTELFSKHLIKAVPMKDSGGIYFIPKPEVETFEKVKRALGVAAPECSLYMNPAFKASDAMTAALDGITREARAAILELEGELNKPEGVGARAARNRVEEIDVLLDKIRGYEILLGRPFEEVITKIEALAARFEQVTSRAANLEID